MPPPEDTFAKLNGGKVFLSLDLSDVYLQVQVNEECSKLLTINIHKRLYKFNQLQFGVKVASSSFQQIIDPMMASLDFAIDNVLRVKIKGNTVGTLEKHLKE